MKLWQKYDIVVSKDVGESKLYIADERFKKNINKYGMGTAEFTVEAIAAYTK